MGAGPSMTTIARPSGPVSTCAASTKSLVSMRLTARLVAYLTRFKMSISSSPAQAGVVNAWCRHHLGLHVCIYRGMDDRESRSLTLECASSVDDLEIGCGDAIDAARS